MSTVPVSTTQANTAGPDASSTPNVGVHVLVADDDTALRTSLSFILQRFGFEVSVACNGQEALSIALSGSVDVVLLDLHMPVMSGLESLTQMRRSSAGRNLPVLIFSQHADRESVQLCVKQTVSGFMVKQALNIEELMERLKAVVAAARVPKGEDGEPEVDEAVEDEPVFDHKAWKDRAMEIGRIPREEAQQIIDNEPLPMIFIDGVKELHESVASDKASPEDMVDSIEQEPRLLLSLLSEANSNQESKSEAGDVLTALNWVGNSGVRKMLQEQVSRAVSCPDDRQNWVLRWWAHAIAVGQFAAHLAPSLQFSPETARIAGMLHDVGRLMILGSDLGDKALTCYELARNMRIPTAAAEQVLLGLNHKQIGAALCRKHHVPADIANVCDSHDFEDPARERLDTHNQKLSALICAADQLAKSRGFGSLPNDELLPLPAMMIEHMDTLPTSISAVIAEIQTLTTWRVGGELPDLGQSPIAMRGKVIEMLTDNPHPGNPFLHAIVQAGATVTPRKTFSDLVDAKAMCDLVLIDHTTESLVRTLPILRRLSQTEHLRQTPQLLLARRSDEPETVLSQAGLDIAVYPTPIRFNTLLQAIQRIT